MAELLDNAVETPAGDVPIIPVTVMAVGAYLVWFGVYYWGSDTRWPSDPLKSLLQGNGLPVPDNSARKEAFARFGQAAASGGGGNPGAQQSGGSTAGAPAGAQTLSHAQLEALWTSNGGDPGKANIAAAVSEAESGGRSWVTSPNPDGGTNVGLWQLDTKGKGAGHTVEQLQFPINNARVTILASSNGTNWSAWQTYRDGTYRQFLA